MELLGLFGHPVSHSFSKKMHTAIIKKLGLPLEYKLFDILPEKLKIAVEGIRIFGLRGVNVTVPHKTAVIPYLDEVAQSAKLCNAVNTIVNNNGKLIGYNTDFEGFKDALDFHGYSPKQKNILVLGAGGAARAIIVALNEMYSQKIYVANRTVEKANELAAEFENVIAIELFKDNLRKITREVDAVINTTVYGMYPNCDVAPLLYAEDLKNVSFVYDIIYNPLKTALLKEAKKAGCAWANGIEMLVRQGAKSFFLWTGIYPPLDVMRSEIVEEEKDGD